MIAINVLFISKPCFGPFCDYIKKSEGGGEGIIVLNKDTICFTYNNLLIPKQDLILGEIQDMMLI